MRINNFEDLATGIQSDALTNEQLYKVVSQTMNLVLSKEQTELPRNELVSKLRIHYNKYLKNGSVMLPLFLELDISLID